jgi:threonine dehydratase
MKIGKIIAPVLCMGMVSLTAFADDKGGFDAQLIGSAVGQHVAGVASGGAPWKVSKGEVSVSTNGRIEVEVKGLLIATGTAVNTVGPVTMVMTSLVCGDVVAASTKAVALTTTGNAEIQDTIQVPSPCIAPAVLVRIAATTTGPVANGPFIAVNALTSRSGDDGNGNGNGNDDHGK